MLRKASLIPQQIQAIGSSTGGPKALAQVVSVIAPQLNVPALITQHLLATFTAILAESLAKNSGRGIKLEPGCIMWRRVTLK